MSFKKQHSTFKRNTANRGARAVKTAYENNAYLHKFIEALTITIIEQLGLFQQHVKIRQSNAMSLTKFEDSAFEKKYNRLIFV